jgi:alpha-beta hydrolase superfamily lysophospholipase
MHAESTLSTFIASDGDNIVIQDWPLAPSVALKGMVIVVHDLGEHAGRYERLARTLNDWGFAVRGYDQCGHGESGGARGSMPTENRLLDDLTDIVDSTRLRLHKDTPLILLGHGLGAIVVSGFVTLATRQVNAVVLSSPVFDGGLNRVQKLILAMLSKFAPNFQLGTGIKPQYLSQDPDVISTYRRDPLVHDRISARLASYLAHAGAQIVAQSVHWITPALLLYAGNDRLLNPQGSRTFAQLAPDHLVTAVCFEKMYHDVFNEIDASTVFAHLKQWLDHRF